MAVGGCCWGRPAGSPRLLCVTGLRPLHFLRSFIHSVAGAYLAGVPPEITGCCVRAHPGRVSRPGPFLQPAGRRQGPPVHTETEAAGPRDCCVPCSLIGARCPVWDVSLLPAGCEQSLPAYRLEAEEPRAGLTLACRTGSPALCLRPSGRTACGCLCTTPGKPGKHHTCAPGCGRGQRAHLEQDGLQDARRKQIGRGRDRGWVERTGEQS